MRVKRAEGKRYLNEEEAKQAIENKSLVVVSSFLSEKPKLPNLDGPSVYSEEPNEDLDGPMTERAIGRHLGDTFSLPGKITTIRGLCRSLDENFYKYYILPGENIAKPLKDLILNASDVSGTCDTPRIYIGRIVNFKYYKEDPHYIRSTFFKYNKKSNYVDICIKASSLDSQEKGITNE